MLGFYNLGEQMTVLRYYIANIDPGSIIATLGNVTIAQALGAFEGIVEPSSIVTVASFDPALTDKRVAELLAQHGEDCALVEKDGKGYILFAAA